MTWDPEPREFLEADVIEWTEAIWPPPSRTRRKKARPWGKQSVVGQISKIEGDMISVLILKAQITENLYSSELRPHKVGTIIRKKQQTLIKGNPERLHWSEEDVRAALVAEQHDVGRLPT